MNSYHLYLSNETSRGKTGVLSEDFDGKLYKNTAAFNLFKFLTGTWVYHPVFRG